VKKKRFAVEQIVAILKQAELGIPIAELIRQVGVSEQTFYWWKKKYGGLEIDQVRQLKQMAEEKPRGSIIRAVLTGPVGRGRRTNSPMETRLTAFPYSTRGGSSRSPASVLTCHRETPPPPAFFAALHAESVPEGCWFAESASARVGKDSRTVFLRSQLAPDPRHWPVSS
jgi:putative transposase